MEKEKIIAIQGIRGSFHEAAAIKYFGENIKPYECDTFGTLCHSLTDGSADYAMMAIENSLTGSILPNYALIRENHLHVIGEVYLHIQMFLMALPGTKTNELKYVHSHPIAIRQCSEYLQNLNNVKVIEKNDTADSAKEIMDLQLKNTAAIANETAAEIYGLEVIEKRIETHKQNFTRFLVLATSGDEKESNNKASICFELGQNVGELSKILGIFTKYHLNLTKIQSLPIIGKPYEYSFHIDLEWKNSDSYEKAIHRVLKNTSNLSILGEYKKVEWDTNNTIDKWVQV